MNIWKFASRWSETGEWGSTILDIFVKNGIAFIYPDGHDLSGIQIGDLIAISDGHKIVAIGQATTRAQKVRDMPGVSLSEADKRKLAGCYEAIEGVRLYLPSAAILKLDGIISYAHTGRFCNVSSPEVIAALKNAWETAQQTESNADFDIQAQRRTLEELLQDSLTRLYMIPVFQRPYAWGEPELERFLSDLISSYQKGKRMFIGTMQLSAKRCLSPRGEFYQEVIDGQQRLTTCALILKALRLMEPENTELAELCRDFSWIESKVNSGQQQERLDAALHSETADTPSEGGINRYLDNCAYIKRYISDTAAAKESQGGEETTTRLFTVDSFFRHMVKDLLFVVIETEAGLSQTIEIFNIINTTGLDLNGGDLFKVRVFEYLTDRCGKPVDCFEDISRLYEKIDSNTNELRKNYTNIHEILGVYQKIIVGRYKMGVGAALFAAETFYERFFDSLLGLKKWEHFSRVHAMGSSATEPLIELQEIEKLIRIRHDFEIRWDGKGTTTFDFNTLLAFYLIDWSRYSRYWWLFLVVELRYPEAPDSEKCAFIQELARLFVVFSLIKGKQVAEIHAFVAALTEDLITEAGGERGTPTKLSTLIQKIQDRTLANKPTFCNVIQGDLASYALPKNLICRLLESLETTNTDMLPSIFTGGYDIEHIQSYNHKDPTQRDNIWKAWGSLISSMGNLMLLESSSNRSISNNAFSVKQPTYRESKFAIAKRIGSMQIADWCTDSAKRKLKKDSQRLCEYLFTQQIR